MTGRLDQPLELPQRREAFVPESNAPKLLTVAEVARVLDISPSWVYKHTSELPSVRVGRLVRFDSAGLQQLIQGRLHSGNSLKPERANAMHPRSQRGYVFQLGKRVKTWYGIFREDVKTPAGIERVQRKVRLGTLSELPTKIAARNKLAALIGDGTPPETTTTQITFRELATRWEQAEGPTIKSSTLLHYRNALRMYIFESFAERQIRDITREDIQTFLAGKAKTYSRSALRSMRTVMSLTLRWAVANGWIPSNPCANIRLPREAGGQRITRVILTSAQIVALAGKLEEPYSTLVFLLAVTGLRIGEAVGVQWADIDGNNVLHVQRRVYIGDTDAVKSLQSVRRLPLDAELVARIGRLQSRYGTRAEWVFQSEAGTPVNPGNALKRYVRPAAEELGIRLGGWHDFRHTLSTTLRRAGVHPKVVSDILGHKKVNLAMDVYDRTDSTDFVAPLMAVAKNVLPSVTKSETA